jgi:hypothetical protein
MKTLIRGKNGKEDQVRYMDTNVFLPWKDYNIAMSTEITEEMIKQGVQDSDLLLIGIFNGELSADTMKLQVLVENGLIKPFVGYKSNL